MERLIFVTQLIDPDDPVLGFVVPQVRVLAAHFDVVVIANEVRSAPDALGADLISLGKEDGRRKLGRGQRYVSAIRSEVRANRSSTILAHMCPIYVDLAAPFAKRYGVPTMLWYVHPADSLTLRVAEGLSDVVLTAFPGSYPRPGPKIEPIGHSIDTDVFEWSAPPAREPGTVRLLALGRTSPVKGYDVMIRALATARRAGVHAELRIVGPSVTALEHRHRAELQALAGNLRAGCGSLRRGCEAKRGRRVVARHRRVAQRDRAGERRQGGVRGDGRRSSGVGEQPGVRSAARRRLAAAFVSRPRRRRVWPTASPRSHSPRPAEIEHMGRALRTRIENEHSLRNWATNVSRVATTLSERRRLSRVVNH